MAEQFVPKPFDQTKKEKLFVGSRCRKGNLGMRRTDMIVRSILYDLEEEAHAFMQQIVTECLCRALYKVWG